MRVKQSTPQMLTLDPRTKTMLDRLSEKLGINKSALVREWIITEASKRGVTGDPDCEAMSNAGK